MLKLIRKVAIAFALLSSTMTQAQMGVRVRASYYAHKFEGRTMANGQKYHGSAFTAASLMFPVGTRIRVTNTRTDRTITLVVTDRGPWDKKFGIDLSRAAFEALGFDFRKGWGWAVVSSIG